MTAKNAESQDKVRLDKWLWAARFYKTRAIAKQMVEGGKVHYNGQRSKCSRMVEVGAKVLIRQGFEEKVVEILKISDQRRGAPEAQLLYQETAESIEKREKEAFARKHAAAIHTDHRPNKKERRKLRGFRESQDI
ncbi:MAG: ribosome-associated heat shock protein Hsp15 [Pontibacterium sp.]